jgi:hypothetical protein
MDDIVFATILASVGALLLWVFWAFIYAPAMVRKERMSPRFVPDSTGEMHDKNVGIRNCPVCGELLSPGMLVKSSVVKSTAAEKLMKIYGCPYCWPENSRYGRICPVCRKIVPRGGYLIARYFDKPTHKHVHVLGCSGCRRG